ncbi:MAG: GAF domain-containing protein [Scytonematopsis contorta HA4267-MV1]|jgi:GAF domain-containing protein|nr:GAF domain-containing protein [Scytonematopsis contorta HA4267-MV1]
MNYQNIYPEINSILTSHQEADVIFSKLLPALGEFLKCDRCFLYLRDPETRLGRVPFYWVRTSDIPVVYDESWKSEPSSLEDEDPMFAAALRTEPSIFIEDVETADPKVLNRQFEQENFGHRALIHAHLCQDGQLRGVLQPCVFGQPRVWSQQEKAVIEEVVQAITPLAVTYVNSVLC